MKTRRNMKKLWSKLFKKNSTTLTPPKELKKLVNSIERDAKGKWVIETENTKLPKDFTAELKKLKEEINNATEATVQVTIKKTAPKKPAPKKPTSAEAETKQAISKKPVAKKPTPKKPKAD